MRKLLILVLTVFTFSFIACDNDDDTTKVCPIESAKPLIVTSFHPEFARGGAELAIYGENFGTTVSENYVTFGGWDAEVLHIPYEGMILVRIPALAPGDYTVSVNANGQTGTCPKAFKILEDINF